MGINKSVILSTIFIIAISLLYFIFVEFNIRILLEHILIDGILIYFSYQILKRQNLLNHKSTKSLTVVSILGWGSFISMVLGFPLILYAIANKNQSLMLTAGILIVLAFLGLLSMIIFLLFITNRKAFKIYIIAIIIGIILDIILLRLTNSVTLFAVSIAVSIVLIISMYVLPMVLAAIMKKRK